MLPKLQHKEFYMEHEKYDGILDRMSTTIQALSTQECSPRRSQRYNALLQKQIELLRLEIGNSIFYGLPMQWDTCSSQA